MTPEERLALLKEITKINKGGTVDERKRAQALLRSLAQNRDFKIGGQPVRPDYFRNRPAIGRTVVTSNLGPGPSGKVNQFDVSFYNNNGTGVSDNPFPGGARNSKYKALYYMLGQALDKDIPNNRMLKIDATDDRRVKAYERGTKGALKFEPYKYSQYSDFETRLPGGTSSTYKNKKGNFQPMIDGKFTKSKPNPADSLRSSLIRAATGGELFRAIRSTLTPNQAPGPAVFDLIGKPIVEGMLKTIGKPGQSNMSRLGIKPRKK